MQLPIRIIQEAPSEPVIAVDGVFGARGLQLSHWPGNTTPVDLRHSLSTGCALAFARLVQGERERRARGAVALANNHYDTDGVCALYAAREPVEALARERALLDAAAAGDFFAWPNDRAVALDQLVCNLGDETRSPIAAELQGLDAPARDELRSRWMVAELPRLIDAEELPHPELWQPELDGMRADRADLELCERSEHPALDLTQWTAACGARSSRDGAPAASFDPGRHALFGASARDRVLVVASDDAGSSYRLLISTRSWFDLPGRSRPSRPDLEGLVERLNQLEGTRSTDEHAWRSQAASNASPELWFGADGLESFAEHNARLAPSRLEPTRVSAELERSLAH